MNCINLASGGFRVGSIFLKASVFAVADEIGGGVLHDVVVLPIGGTAESLGWCGLGQELDIEMLSAGVVSKLNLAHSAGHLSAHELMEGLIAGGEMLSEIEAMAAERIEWMMKANDPTSRVRATIKDLAGDLRSCDAGGNRKARRAASSKRRR